MFFKLEDYLIRTTIQNRKTKSFPDSFDDLLHSGYSSLKLIFLEVRKKDIHTRHL